ncbi:MULTISPECIES: hypothetical protein [unclassified Paenibacillus]|uniref:hypothetical protein n=1 Tax=unclassified Paenibacillus TaxID=185978 RepID=UPI000CF8A120|nr:MULTISPECIES: hypothetical protein [unclassified Paenibacillus]MBJ9989894.1 hypothetical protein [Paenibacillus sp. S28]PQP86294.1 hypothetical protein CPT76_32005 [Paenibacillus sp. AR247]
MEALGFMFFSTLETFAIYSLTMSLFRFKTSDYLWQALCITLLANVQSYVMRDELSLAFAAPLITILIYILLYTTVMKIPLAWSAICTILGYALYALIQTVYVLWLFGSVQEASATDVNSYSLQVVSALTGLGVSWLMYKFGIGFAFDFERLRFKKEHIVLVLLIMVTLVLVEFIFYYNKVWINVLFFACTFGLFLYYTIRKEEEDIHAD